MPRPSCRDSRGRSTCTGAARCAKTPGRPSWVWPFRSTAMSTARPREAAPMPRPRTRGVDETVERRARRAHRVLVAGPNENEDLETRPVVQLQQLRHQVRRRVLVEIGGEVADADLARAVRCPGESRRAACTFADICHRTTISAALRCRAGEARRARASWNGDGRLLRAVRPFPAKRTKWRLEVCVQSQICIFACNQLPYRYGIESGYDLAAPACSSPPPRRSA